MAVERIRCDLAERKKHYFKYKYLRQLRQTTASKRTIAQRQAQSFEVEQQESEYASRDLVATRRLDDALGVDGAQEFIDELYRNNSPAPSQSQSNNLDERSQMAMMYQHAPNDLKGLHKNETFYAARHHLLNPGGQRHPFNLSFTRH